MGVCINGTIVGKNSLHLSSPHRIVSEPFCQEEYPLPASIPVQASSKPRDTGGEVENDACFEIACVHSEREN